MNKKLLALAVVGAAAWLFKTEKGAEVRKNLGKQAGDLAAKAGDLANKAKDMYTKRAGQAEELAS